MSEPTPSASAPAARPLSPLQKALRKLGLETPMDFALHVPLRYEDETRIVKLRDAMPGQTVQIEGVVTACEVAYRPRRQLVATVDDGSGVVTARFFHFYPGQQKAMSEGNRVILRGEIKHGFMGAAMLHPSFRAAGGELPQALTPVYPSSGNLPQAYLRRAVVNGLQRAQAAGLLSETIPADALQDLQRQVRQSPWPLQQALQYLHHPAPDASIAALEDRSHPAWMRLKAEELLAQQLSQAQAHLAREKRHAPALPLRPGGLHEKLLAALPFALTGAQRRVAEEIAQDLQLGQPMHRLLQGDVGSGKTVVAALAAAICIDAGWQCALMAPTEILAEQHFRKLLDWLTPLGVGVAWLTGSQKTKERREMLARIVSGEAQLVVGTHAVIQEQVQFLNLALAVIDEQHRFGVAQRLALRQKLAHANLEPHLLMMSATPIPRTLAMSYYADLDVSVIDELPPGRTPIVTRVLPDSRKDELIERLAAQLAQGRQVYWVCPLIEESETLDLSNATATHAELSAALPGVLVGLLHSRMSPAEKKAVMQMFASGLMGLLVATTVIEVGVDVPNASLMVIEHAERFGLSQLHQLRGRVGRGAVASACVLLYSVGDSGKLSDNGKERLRAMAETNDGFEIARRDLEIRGPGEFLGARQSGAAMLRFADLEQDMALLEWARELAPQMLQQYPRQAQQHIERWLGSKAEYLKA